MSSPAGLEIVFHTVKEQIKSKEDVLITVIHWFMIKNGCKCVGTSDKWDSEKEERPSELLPLDWNANQSLYTLRYAHEDSGQRLLLKLIPAGSSILVNILNVDLEKAAAVSLSLNKFVTDNFKNFTDAYKDLKDLEKQLNNEIKPIFCQAGSSVPPSSPTTSRFDNTQSVHSPLIDPLPRSMQPPPIQSWPNPTGVGRADLDPFNRGGIHGGGMLFDPRNLPGGIRPRAPFGPGQLPRGAVPPGARFDPFGPTPPSYNPRLGGPPTGFSGPDPDHLPPPGYDDMFS